MIDNLKRLAGYFYGTLYSFKKKEINPNPHELVAAAALILGVEDGKIEGCAGWQKVFLRAAEWNAGRKFDAFEKKQVERQFNAWVSSGVYNEKNFPAWVRQYCRHKIEEAVKAENEIRALRRHIFKRCVAYALYSPILFYRYIKKG